MKVCLGGTFDIIHIGHEKLFEKAIELAGADGEISIGLTSDSFAKRTRNVRIKPHSEREKSLIDRFSRYDVRVSVKELDDRYGPSITEDFDCIVVSPETKSVAEEINGIRKSNGLRPLEIFPVEHFLADDGLPVSSTRIRNLEIDRDGNLIGEVVVAVGSDNPVKLDAVGNVLRKRYDEVRVIPVKVEPDVPKQPFEDDTVKGALNRAKDAMERCDRENKKPHFGVGIEAGLFWKTPLKKYFDVQYCAIIDRGGRVTVGHGSGFYYPDEVIREVEKGSSVGEAMDNVYGLKEIGRSTGAIGYLSDGTLNRTQLTEQAVLAALIPRMRKGAYF